MKTQLVEIYPGVTIEVSSRLKQKAGIGRTDLIREKLDPKERARIMGDLVKDQKPNRKHSTLIVDEAVRLSKEMSIPKAAKITGVSNAAILARRKELRASGELKKHLYTMDQKRECVALAHKLMADPGIIEEVKDRGPGRGMIKRRKWNQKTAFVEAGRQLGMNGISVLSLWAKGMITDQPSTPRPKKPRVAPVLVSLTQWASDALDRHQRSLASLPP